MSETANWLQVKAGYRSELWYAQQDIVLCETLKRASCLFPNQERWTQAASVLDLGCGEGAWIRALLRTSQPQQVLGVDTQQRSIATARHLTPQQDYPQALFVRRSLHSLTKPGSKWGTFDAIRLALPCETWLVLPIPYLLRRLYESCAPGGVLSWSLVGLPILISISPVLTQLCGLLCQGLLLWQGCAEPEMVSCNRDMEQALSVASVTIDNTEPEKVPHTCDTEQENKIMPTLGVWMQNWLAVAGFEQIRQQTCELDISAGSPLHHLFRVRLEQALARLEPWLWQQGMLQSGVWETLYLSLWKEVRAKQFAACLPIVHVSGVRPQIDGLCTASRRG